MAENIYAELRERLDQYSVGFPASESGIEFKILKYLFSEDDAALFLALTPRLEAPEAVADRIGRPVDETADRLEDMSRRGLLFRLEKGGRVKYGAIPFVHGLFEFQVADLDRELAGLVEEYFYEAFDLNMQRAAEYFLRTVPVARSVDAVHNVASFDDAAAMLRTKEYIVITDCICRKQKKLVDQGCDRPLEACFMFGSMGKYYVDRGMGRQIDQEEALAILAKCQESGLVTQPATAQNPGGMCNCCGDCCGVLRALNRHPQPAGLVFSNHFAVVDEDECTGCETCLDRCQMEAISLNDDGLAEINLDRCIGCGLCVTTCPTEALALRPKAEDERRRPPANTSEQMLMMAQKRGLI